MQLSDQLQEEVSALFGLIVQIQGALGDTPVPRNLKEAINNFHVHHTQFLRELDTGAIESIAQAARNAAIYGVSAAQQIASTPPLPEGVKTIGRQLGEKALALQRKAENDPSTYSPLGEIPISRRPALTALPQSVLKRIEDFMVEQEKQDARVKKSLTENERRIAGLADEFSKLEVRAQKVLSDLGEIHDSALVEINAKKDQIDEMLGHATGRVVAGDYEANATLEKRIADILRWASLTCMGVVIAMLGYTLLETSNKEFQWERSLYRVALVFLLSAPAAYLARESAKHRSQQYQHLQTSLALKAITPYLASLPDEVQHQIKAEVAAKLFAGRDTSASSDSFPINANELLLELVKKLELPKVPPVKS